MKLKEDIKRLEKENENLKEMNSKLNQEVCFRELYIRHR